jgi:hypothetical protein
VLVRIFLGIMLTAHSIAFKSVWAFVAFADTFADLLGFINMAHRSFSIACPEF